MVICWPSFRHSLTLNHGCPNKCVPSVIYSSIDIIHKRGGALLSHLKNYNIMFNATIIVIQTSQTVDEPGIQEQYLYNTFNADSFCK